MGLMPRRLYVQLVFVVSLIIIFTIMAYGYFTGKKQTGHALETMKIHAELLSKNLAVSSADYMLASNYAGLETLLKRHAEFPEITEIQICDRQGNILSDIVRTPGSPPKLRFGKKIMNIPATIEPLIEMKNKEMIIWQPVYTGALLGWVRTNHNMENIYEIQKIIWENSLLVGVLGIFASLILLLVSLKKPLGAIQRVTAFARRLNYEKGSQIPVERGSVEIEQLCESLNTASFELLSKENQLRAERERLSITLQSIGDGVIATDTNGGVVLINKVAEYLTGWKMQDAEGMPLTEVFRIINEKTRKPVENPVDKVLKTGKIIGLANHTALIAKDGTERSIADSAAPIADKEGKIIGVVLVFRDTTEKNKMEEEILRARKLESLGTIAGGIAHDFNNILTAILGNISMVTGFMSADDTNYKRLTAAEKATIRARDLAQQLLTFSKGGSPILKTAHIGDLLRETIIFSLSGSNIKADITIPDNLWLVEIDEGQMSQVIQNLVINARESMPGGGTLTASLENITVDAKSALPLNKGDYIKLTIADEGAGIPKEQLPLIFDPYFTTKEKGSGLGLATVYSIIKRHHGHITAESVPGSGTIFYIYLPMSKNEYASAAESPEASAVSNITNKKILVMDDEQSIRELAGDILSSFGHRVDFAAEGKQAINLYKSAMESGQPYDAVIMDLTTPGGMGGKEAIKALAGLDPNIKGIVSSGYSDDPVMSEFREYGFKGVVTKPYSADNLISVLSRVIIEK